MLFSSAESQSNERERLIDLARYDILDTPPEESFNAIVRIAANMLATPIAFMSFLDDTRQWFKARIGLDVPATSREISFCKYTVVGRDIYMVPDAASDERFRRNPLVTGAPFLRFYAGAPICSRAGHNLGTVCIADRV